MEKYQTFWRRFVALLIDGFIMVPLMVIDSWFRDAGFPITFFYVWITFSTAVSPVYRILMHGYYGQTLAKMAMGIKVVSVHTEGDMTMMQAMLRELPQILFGIGAIYLSLAYFGIEMDPEKLPAPYNVFGTLAFVWTVLNFATFLRSPKRRALHDHLAGTVTVRTSTDE